MKEMQWTGKLYRYEAISEIADGSHQELCHAAEVAMQDAYAVYSNYQVGSAVLMSNGQIIKGANQENAVYPLGLCAERVAIFSANTQVPAEQIVAIAICTKKTIEDSEMPAFPCGSCRQVLVEQEKRFGLTIPVYVMNTDHKVFMVDSIREILPFSFDDTYL